MSEEPVRRRKNRKTNTSLGIPYTLSFPLLPTHECRAVNLHMMTLKILFHMDVKWGSRPLTGQGRDGIQVYENAVYQSCGDILAFQSDVIERSHAVFARNRSGFWAPTRALTHR